MARSSVAKRLRGWAYAPDDRPRDLRIDLLRGYAVFAMVVDHVGGESWFTPLTGLNRFLVSAAEGFVFLSGLVMGMVYGRRIDREGWVPTAEAMLRRAALLYAVTVGLTLLFVSLFLFTDLRLWIDRAYGLGLTDPVELVVGTLTLHYTYHGTDILWMYTVLIAATPILFHLLITGRTVLLLAASVALWLAYQHFPARATIPWVADNAVYFPVAAWQLYFVFGLAMGYHRDAVARCLGSISRWPALAVATVGFAGLIVVHWGHDTGRLASWPLLQGLSGETYEVVFNKPSVSGGRVAAFALAATFLFLVTTQFWRPIHRLLGPLLLPLGQASLLAYGLHLIVIVIVYNLDVWNLYNSSRAANTLLQAVAVGGVWGLVTSWGRLSALPGRLTRLLDAPVRRPARGRVALVAASVLAVAMAASSASLIGPIRPSRPATSMEQAASAGTLVYVPESLPADAPAQVLLVLHDEGATGPTAALPLIDEARRAGWIVIAPSLEYRSWETPDDVRADAMRWLPSLRALIDELHVHVEHPTPGGALIYGEGRGGQLAHIFAIFYPELVRGVATVNAIPCTLPVVSLAAGGEDGRTEFPIGLDDLVLYRGERMDSEALGQIHFWIQPTTSGSTARGCEWLDSALPTMEQVDSYARLLTHLGADVQVAADDGILVPPTQRALRFLEQATAR